MQNRRTPAAGGIFLFLGPVIGALYGIGRGEPILWMLYGFGVGVVAGGHHLAGRQAAGLMSKCSTSSRVPSLS